MSFKSRDQVCSLSEVNALSSQKYTVMSVSYYKYPVFPEFGALPLCTQLPVFLAHNIVFKCFVGHRKQKEYDDGALCLYTIIPFSSDNIFEFFSSIPENGIAVCLQITMFSLLNFNGKSNSYYLCWFFFLFQMLWVLNTEPCEC